MKKVSKSLFNNPKYRGRHVLISGSDVHAVKTSKEASKLFDRIVKDTGVAPMVTFVPKSHSLILVCK